MYRLICYFRSAMDKYLHGINSDGHMWSIEWTNNNLDMATHCATCGLAWKDRPFRKG